MLEWFSLPAVDPAWRTTWGTVWSTVWSTVCQGHVCTPVNLYRRMQSVVLFFRARLANISHGLIKVGSLPIGLPMEVWHLQRSQLLADQEIEGTNEEHKVLWGVLKIFGVYENCQKCNHRKGMDNLSNYLSRLYHSEVAYA